MRIALFITFFCFCLANGVDFTDRIYKLSNQIRGDEKNCFTNAGFYSTKTKEIITLGLSDPKEYAKMLPQKDEYERLVDEGKEYFRFWAVKSISNFILFNEFNKEFISVVPKLNKYYQGEFALDEPSAIFFATHIANEFLFLSVGDYYKAYKLTKLENMMLNEKLDINEFINELYLQKPNKHELTNLLYIALLKNQDKVLFSTLINMGAMINSGDESAIFFALKNRKNVEFLLKNGADVNYENSFGKTPLFYAIDFKDNDLIKFLVKNGANVNKKYISNTQKDAIASGIKNIPFFQNLCALEHTSRTVFMHAAFHSTPEILNFLIKNGADIQAKDDLGYNALDYALIAKNSANIEFLSATGLKSNLGEIK